MGSDRHVGRVRLLPPTLEATMQTVADRPEAPTAIRTDLGAIFVSLELSRSTWLITSLWPGGGEKMSKQVVRGGDVAELLERFARLREKARARTGKVFPFVVIQEAGLDGFWIDRALQNEGIESHVVDPASIATSRRRRRAKTDGIDGEALVRALLAYKRGEPRVCAMVKAPTPHEEDRRRISRERETLTAERVQHVNRIKGLLFAQGISNYEPLHRNRRERLEELITGDGRPLPECLKAQIRRELDRLELVIEQVKAVEAERDALLAHAQASPGVPAPATHLLALNGIGPEAAATLWSEGLFRRFSNRKQVSTRLGGPEGDRLVGAEAAPPPSCLGHAGRAGGVQKKLEQAVAEERAQPPDTPIEVWATDEHRIGLKPISRRVWAPKGQRPIALGHHRYKWLYVTAFVQPISGETFWYVSNGVSKPFFAALLALFAREAGAGRERILVLGLDNAGWHTAPNLVVPEGLRLVYLPSYSPELQPAEHLWPVLDGPLANQYFETLADLEHVVTERCRVLNHDQLKPGTNFHWWPKPDIPA